MSNTLSLIREYQTLKAKEKDSAEVIDMFQLTSTQIEIERVQEEIEQKSL